MGRGEHDASPQHKRRPVRVHTHTQVSGNTAHAYTHVHTRKHRQAHAYTHSQRDVDACDPSRICSSARRLRGQPLELPGVKVTGTVFE